MAMRFLPGIFRFSWISSFLLVIIFFGLLSFFTTKMVFAAKWFATYGGGALSGNTSSVGIKDDGIPSSTSLPTDFNPNIVQHVGSENMTKYGSLISSGAQDVKNGDGAGVTDDAFITNIGLDFTLSEIFTSTNQIKGSGYTEIHVPSGSCGSLNLNSLNTVDSASKVYRTSVGCMESAINATGGSYNLSGDGLAVIFVYVEGDSVLNIDSKLVSSDPVSPENERLIAVTEARVRLGDGVENVSPLPSFYVNPDLQASIFSSYSSSDSYYLPNASGNPFIVEGPLIADNDVSVGTDPSNSFPGFYVKYNPSYTVGISKSGVSAVHIEGILESKTTWRYD